MNILYIKLQHYFKAVPLLHQYCLLDISTITDYRHINDTIDTYKDMYEYFRHQTSTLFQGWSLAAAVLFVTYFNNNGL